VGRQGAKLRDGSVRPTEVTGVCSIRIAGRSGDLCRWRRGNGREMGQGQNTNYRVTGMREKPGLEGLRGVGGKQCKREVRGMIGPGREGIIPTVNERPNTNTGQVRGATLGQISSGEWQ